MNQNVLGKKIVNSTKIPNIRIQKEITAETSILYSSTSSVNDPDDDDVVKNCDNEDFRQSMVDLRRKYIFFNKRRL